MKQILLLCMVMAPLSGNASSISDILKENKLTAGLGIAAIGCAYSAYYFNQNMIIKTTSSTDSKYNTKRYSKFLPRRVIDNNCRHARNVSLICSSIFASLAILKYMRK